MESQFNKGLNTLAEAQNQVIGVDPHRNEARGTTADLGDCQTDSNPE